MQTKNYDSTFCGSVPLHQINLIQPYGILLVLQQSDYKIIQVSENISEALGLDPSAVINTPVTKYIAEEQLALLLDRLQENLTDKVPVTISFNGDTVKKDYLAITHQSGEAILLEMEELPPSTPETSFINIYQQLKYAMVAINAAPSVNAACDVAARELKKLSGFDKVMVYKFDKDWNGTVIAEALEPGMEAYLGLTFPASDIPRQARAMYLKNPYRLIANRDYVPVSLYPIINPLTNAFTDLSGCNLRSVPAVHLEYLKNMNVMSSMSCRILKDGQLWGLFSCHHRTEYHLPYEGRALFELLSDIISARVVSLQYKEEGDLNTRLNEIHTRLVEQIYNSGDLVDGLMQPAVNILHLLGAQGAVISHNKRIETIGKTPNRHALKDLIFWLQGLENKGIFQEIGLPAVFDAAREYADIASGILVIPIQPQKGEFLVAFRPEVIQHVNWGGNPDEAIRFEQDNIQYHPRNSFNIWQQTVKHTALPWNGPELLLAGHLRNFILDYILKGLD
jgi:two-component system, chemotaxis family, sensor kinase Cph1